MAKSVTDVTLVYGQWTENLAKLAAGELGKAGISTRMVCRQPDRSVGEIALLVLLAIPLRTFLEAFGTSLGESAGTAVRSIVNKVVRGGGDNQCIVIRDSELGIDLIFAENLPAEAYDQLIRSNFLHSGLFCYDQDRKAWVAVDQKRAGD